MSEHAEFTRKLDFSGKFSPLAIPRPQNKYALSTVSTAEINSAYPVRNSVLAGFRQSLEKSLATRKEKALRYCVVPEDEGGGYRYRVPTLKNK